MTKRYYVTGNYSKYVKPGAKRIEASTDDKDVLVTAFKNNEEIVLVFVNNSNAEKQFSLSEEKEILISVTDKDNNLKESVIGAKDVTLTPKSVTTVVIK
jgi:glucosylceramidase